jgi:uncharacterized protein (DUF362 family)
MILDLNKVLLYANPEGTLRLDAPESRKHYISVVDAIISGEGNGPEAPDPKHTGLLIAGTNPVAVDAVCTRVMGFDWLKIPSVKNTFDIKHYPVCDFTHSEITIASGSLDINGTLSEARLPDHEFHPHFGWKDHIEA